MTGPVINLRQLANGAQTTTPVEGTGGFHALVPVPEPISVGPPPVTPDLVSAAVIGWEIRSARARSGHVITGPLDTTPKRPTWEVQWLTLTTAQRTAMRGWLSDTVKGQLYAWELELDGPGTGVVLVRFVTEPSELFKERGAFEVVKTTVEEVYA